MGFVVLYRISNTLLIMNLTTFDTRKGRVVKVGTISKGTLFRNVESKHFMRILNGYGIQEVAFQEFREMGGKWIVQKVIPTGDMWRASVKDWMIHSSLQDYGHGKQRFLSLKYMKMYKPKPDLDKKPEISYDTKLRLSELWKGVLDKQKKIV